MSEQSPTWYITRQPNTDWNEANAARFDGATWFRHPISIGVDHPHYQPPLHPQQPTPEQIADAAREALADMQIVLRIWPYGPLSPLTWMRALVALLTPPAPTWTTPDDDPAERAWHYGTDERGRIPEDE